MLGEFDLVKPELDKCEVLRTAGEQAQSALIRNYLALELVYREVGLAQQAEDLLHSAREISGVLFEKIHPTVGLFIHVEKLIQYLLGKVKKEELPVARLFLFWDLYKEEHFEEVVELCEKAIKIENIDVDILFFLGVIYSKMQEYEKAIEIFQRVFENKLLHLKTLFVITIAYKQTKQYSKAMTMIQKYLSIKPNDYEAWRLQGDIYALSDQYMLAYQSYLEADKHNNDDPNIGYRIVLMCTLLDCYDEAMEVYNRIRNDVHQESLVHFYYQNRRYEEAFPLYQTAMKLLISSGITWYSMGRLYERLEDYEKAIMAYNRAADYYPDDFALWSTLGELNMSLRQYSEAAQNYRRAVELNPLSLESWNNLGTAYFQYFHYEEALQAYKEALKLDANDPDLWLNLGLVCEELTDEEEAVQAYQRVIDLESDYIRAYELLGEIYYKNGNASALEQLCRNGLDLERENYILRSNLALALLQTGATAEAREMMVDVVKQASPKQIAKLVQRLETRNDLPEGCEILQFVKAHNN